MKKVLAWMLLCAVSFTAQADDSCGLRVAKLLSAGKAAPLAELFQGRDELLPALQQLTEKVGPLSAVEEASGPRFKVHTRTSIGPGVPGSAGRYVGYWINANSEKMGAIQLHIAEAPESTCHLLALHVDSML